MGYINGNKVFQVVKVVMPPQFYKHSVKMQCEYDGINYTIYAEFISKDNTNWATAGLTFSDIELYDNNGWTGVIAGYDDHNNKFQYAHLGGISGSGQSELYFDIENQGNVTIDSGDLSFIEDTVTPLN